MALAPPTALGLASRGFADIDGAEDPSFFLRYLLDASADEQVEEMKQASLELLRLKPGLDVLEVGVGLGDELWAMARAVAPGRAAGIDGSARVVEFAHVRHPELEILVGDARSLPYPDASFDRYRAERLYQHLPEPELALAEALRVLRPGGRLAIGDPDWRTLRLGSANEDIEELLRERVCQGVQNPQAAYRLGPALMAQRARLLDVVSYRMRFSEARTIERIVDSVQAGFSAAEREQVLAEARRLEADGSLYGSLSLVWVVGAKPA